MCFLILIDCYRSEIGGFDCYWNLCFVCVDLGFVSVNFGKKRLELGAVFKGSDCSCLLFRYCRRL